MKKIVIISTALALTILVIGGYFYSQEKDSVLGGASVITDTTIYPLYPSGVTKQFILDVRDAEGAFLDVSMTASTSDSSLYWTYEFTNQENCGFNADPDDCSWYGEDMSEKLSTEAAAIGTGLTVIPHSTTTVINTWNNTSVTSSTTNKRIIIEDINAKFMRTTFWAVTSTSSITVQQGATN